MDGGVFVRQLRGFRGVTTLTLVASLGIPSGWKPPGSRMMRVLFFRARGVF